MPKIKSHKGVAKRFKITAKGKILRKRAGKSHLLSKKRAKRKRKLRKKTLVHLTQIQTIKRLLR